MSKAMEIKQLLQQLVDKPAGLLCFVAEVLEVEGDACKVKVLSSDLELTDVNLMAKQAGAGLYAKPSAGSLVLVTMINNQAYISLMSEVDVLQLHGDQHGGLIKVQELKTQLDKNTAILDALIKGITKTEAIEPGNNTASVFQAILAGLVAGLPLGDFSKLENEKVKHG